MFAILITLATLTLTTDARLDKSLPKIDPSTWNRYDFEGTRYRPCIISVIHNSDLNVKHYILIMYVLFSGFETLNNNIFP